MTITEMGMPCFIVTGIAYSFCAVYKYHHGATAGKVANRTASELAEQSFKNIAKEQAENGLEKGAKELGQEAGERLAKEAEKIISEKAEKIAEDLIFEQFPDLSKVGMDEIAAARSILSPNGTLSGVDTIGVAKIDVDNIKIHVILGESPDVRQKANLTDIDTLWPD